ncbi:MATE family efflux transporter [Haloarcula japonica]|uniref:Multidrug-efflux transporter n=1 Tax=Haloarcula japonica (strain ATCC 49778 / DSM 6131 / JCM 7785 / NBRC 101032 / NCIMB 13157 / TR-1) TaxID=1227453 RepID=M0LN51_HALJT|nr:MATE family efflux transporter [Haloarcula japonica]EMA34508.1 DNA damage-inducible protein [Haloarcula japonica DSM 6131]
MPSTYNPVRGVLLFVGGLLARVGLVERERVRRATDLSWPRIVTGVARMSKSTVDVAMVGLALGPTAIAGVGFAAPFWELVFALGGGVAGGTIGMVSQRYGADADEELAVTVTTSAAVVLGLTLPLMAAYWVVPSLLVDLVGTGSEAVGYGTRYLRVAALGVPFAALNLIASRTLVGADDAWSPMLLRAGGAVVNIALNAVLIFGFSLGVVGAALGTVIANVLVTTGFAVGLARGGLPIIGAFPVRIPVSRPFVDRGLGRDLAETGAPLVGANLARTGAQFPRLFIVGLFGPGVVSAYVVALRVRALLDTPNWGLSLASSSLVGQALGDDDEGEATVWAQTVLRLSIGVYIVVAATLLPFSRGIARLFVSDPTVLPLVTVFVAVACASVVFRGVDGGSTGPLRASGDTRWPFYSQLAGMYLFALPLAYLGYVTPLGELALYASLMVETAVPAAVTYYRFRSGTWRVVSRSYRPDTALDD